MTILKELIENMIYDYLEESYEDDLVESIFEEVSEDTWEAIQEAILNELSPELLQRYRKKASSNIKSMDKKRKELDTKDYRRMMKLKSSDWADDPELNKNTKDRNSILKKTLNRSIGSDRAKRKIDNKRKIEKQAQTRF